MEFPNYSYDSDSDNNSCSSRNSRVVDDLCNDIYTRQDIINNKIESLAMYVDKQIGDISDNIQHEFTEINNMINQNDKLMHEIINLRIKHKIKKKM
jgi:hypothetical protein